jgi:hypothetical protein
MSTRGCVAIGTPSKWRGVYNHWDSYPTCLGRAVWEHLQTTLKNGKTLEEFARELLTYDDWRAYLNQGICEYCGKRTTQPHSISGVIFSPRSGEKFKTKAAMRRFYRALPAWRGRDAEIEKTVETEWRIRENIKRTGHPDPKATYHEHATRPVDEQHITSDSPDPLFIEWVYIIDPASATFHVLAHNGKSNPANARCVGESCRPDGDGRWDYGHCVYWHELVGHFPLNGTAPDWEKLEAKAR